MTKIAANKTQLGFLRINILDLTDTLHRFMLCNITAQAINGIGGINDHTAFFKAFHQLFNQPWLRVLWVNLYSHNKILVWHYHHLLGVPFCYAMYQISMGFYYKNFGHLC